MDAAEEPPGKADEDGRGTLRLPELSPALKPGGITLRGAEDACEALNEGGLLDRTASGDSGSSMGADVELPARLAPLRRGLLVADTSSEMTCLFRCA